ncbi:MAG: hypothetical protein IJ321_10680 [Alistipes sp.]|uniref:hypothetical protein n=1 Tax=Alistipes sp. TaxID=1872444 RepID=UPI0023F40B9D|nr:hypothetical protein [Alistipes sp.]MBQ7894390.1 hypothetical protein [Alistipes sp.]
MHWMIACDFFIKKAGINRHITEKYVTLSRITQSRDSTMKKNGIYMLLTVAVMLVIALQPSSSQPRSDKAADTVISLEQSRDDGIHNLRGCEGVFTASQSRITECRHNETYSRIVSESGLPHSESLTLKKSSDAVPCIRPTLHYKYASHRLHLFSRLNI